MLIQNWSQVCFFFKQHILTWYLYLFLLKYDFGVLSTTLKMVDNSKMYFPSLMTHFAQMLWAYTAPYSPL